jgi:type IX secretion system PorP/SprF family membrane protein
VKSFLSILSKWLCLIILFGLTQLIDAQELSLYDNYLSSHLYNINPAAAGFDGAFKTTLSISKKWIGFGQSPSAQIVSNSLKLGDVGFYDDNMFLNRPLFNVAPHVGLGFSVFNESSGPLHHTGILLAYSYHIRLGKKRISFGLSASAAQHYINNHEFKPVTQDDPVLNSRNSSFIPDFNLGTMYYAQRWYVGLSADRIVNTNITMDHVNTHPDIFVFGGYKYGLNTNVTIEPSLFIHINGDKTNSIDINCHLRYHDNNWLLISYRLNREVIAGFGLNILDGIQIGYNYGINSTGLSGYLKGSHNFSIYADIAHLSLKLN